MFMLPFCATVSINIVPWYNIKSGNPNDMQVELTIQQSTLCSQLEIGMVFYDSCGI